MGAGACPRWKPAIPDQGPPKDMQTGRSGYLHCNRRDWTMAYFGRDANPLLVTAFLAVWTLVGVLYLIDALKAL